MALRLLFMAVKHRRFRHDTILLLTYYCITDRLNFVETGPEAIAEELTLRPTEPVNVHLNDPLTESL